MKFSFSTFSERGPRSVNEDAVGVWSIGHERLLVAVADGLGGMGGGDAASAMAIDALANFSRAEAPSADQLPGVMNDIHVAIKHRQVEEERLGGMATTLSVVLVEGSMLYGVHCGDTRVMIARGHGIKRLTRDHTEVMRLLEGGKITKSEYVSYPRKNVLYSALGGTKSPEIQEFSFSLRSGDWILITSDGVHQKIPTSVFRDICLRRSNAESYLEDLRKCLELVVIDDNFSAAVVRVS